MSAELRQQLYSPEFLAAADQDLIDSYTQALDDIPEDATPLERQLHLDFRFHLPNDMLVKVDRMSMAHALEVRVPFLDQETIAACLAMPAECKRRGGRGKLPLRGILAADLPPRVVERKKAGFLIPLERWLKGPWQPLMRELLTKEFAASTGLFQPTAWERLQQDYARGSGGDSYAMFALLMLALWWERYLTQPTVPQSHARQVAPTQVRRLAAARAE